MNTQQKLLIVGSIVLLGVLLLAKTINPKKETVQPTAKGTTSLSFDTILVKAKEKLSPNQLKQANFLEGLTQANTTNQQQAFTNLAKFWKDTVHLFEPYAYYTAQAAKLENSEKSLTFAAQQFVDNLLGVGEPALQTWLATQAKDLFERALKLNPSNDSSKIGLGACYILGNISNNPMEGILPIREIVTKNPNNLYAQYVLGIGGRKSNQLDKAIERFLIVANADPKNILAIINLAECYELKQDKTNAVKWYNAAKPLVKEAFIVEELNKRINNLK